MRSDYIVVNAILCQEFAFGNNPDSKVHGADMGPSWVLSAPDGPHVGPMNLAIRELFKEPSSKPRIFYSHQMKKF